MDRLVESCGMGSARGPSLTLTTTDPARTAMCNDGSCWVLRCARRTDELLPGQLGMSLLVSDDDIVLREFAANQGWGCRREGGQS